MNARKDELLNATIDYLAQHGVADLTLRPLSAAIGTSARLIIFHFKSKEDLLMEVMIAVQARLRNSLTSISLEDAAAKQISPMKLFWNWAIKKSNFPYLRLLYEMHFIAIQNREVYQRFLDHTSFSWLEIIEGYLPVEMRSKAVATLCGAVFEGLVIELLSTEDVGRTTKALDHFIEMLRHEWEHVKENPVEKKTARSARKKPAKPAAKSSKKRNVG